MFLRAVLARNPELVEVAAGLHRAGAVPPDTYVIDQDAVEANAALLAEGAGRYGLGLWFVVKQLGRSPGLIRAIARHLPRAAAIDAPEARALHAAGARAGNLGHLVQIPPRALPRLLRRQPSFVTVFDADNARAVSAAARRLGLVQKVLVRIEGAPGTVYPGQEGGVPPAGLDAFAAQLETLPGIRVGGVTGFPCVRCDSETGAPEVTPTLGLLSAARALLQRRGHGGLVLSAPGATCLATMPLLAAHGATHGEPGHALTGTTPLHARDLLQPERPGYVYVTEVAHTLADGRTALHGGGFYPRGDVREALLHRSGLRLPVEPAPQGNIDYYRLLAAPPPGVPRPRAGDTALLAFRTQMFVTRSSIAVVSGLADGTPALTALHGPLGDRGGPG